MNDEYYKQKLFVAKVDKSDKLIGPIERWKAHKEGILHRGFTAILTCNNSYILQHRKHIAFNKVWDFTFSSHQLYDNHNLESDRKAIHSALIREWGLHDQDIDLNPHYLGKVYYKAKDPNSQFTEHEYDYIYLIDINTMPTPQPDFAYGITVKNSIEEVKKTKNLAPWVTKILNQITLPSLS